jgi:Phage integrase, N-terminal SAM-like domain
MDASPRISPLRQRMLDDMRMRKLSEKTQTHYLRWVQRFAAYLGRSPDSATVEDLRRYQLHLVDGGTSPISLNAAITKRCAPRFCRVAFGSRTPIRCRAPRCEELGPSAIIKDPVTAHEPSCAGGLCNSAVVSG